MEIKSTRNFNATIIRGVFNLFLSALLCVLHCNYYTNIYYINHCKYFKLCGKVYIHTYIHTYIHALMALTMTLSI